jgi:hypothetical protein
MTRKADKETVLQIMVLAQNIIRYKGDRRIDPNDVRAVNNFIRRANFGSTRSKVTMKECEKIINIARKYS